MAVGGAGAVYAKKANDFFDLPFPGTQAGIQAAIDYAGIAGQIYLGPGNYTNVNNLTMFAKQRLYGAGTLATQLTGSGSGSGIFLREKTAGEGNGASGATGIIVENLSIFANGHTGSGIDFGNQGGASFNSLASLIDVLVRDFASGTGVKLNANAIHCRNVWSLANSKGFVVAGGANHYSGFWAESNTTTQIESSAPYDSWIHPQLEQNGVNCTQMIDMKANANQTCWIGLYMALSFNATQLVVLRSSCINNSFFATRVNPNGHTYTNTIYVEAWTGGSGAKDFMPFWCDAANTQPSHLYNQSTNEDTQFVGAALVMDCFLSEKQSGLTDAATIATDCKLGNSFIVTLGGNRTMGAPTNLRNGQRITYLIKQDGTGGRTLAWNAAFKTAWVDTGNTLNKRSTISFRYDGTNWNQEGAQSPYI